MWSRLYFTVAGVLFVGMNLWLLQSEFGGNGFSISIPVKTVVQHVLESADASTLEIRHHGEKIGYCRWFSQPVTPPTTSTNEVLEGMVTGISAYNVDFDGSVRFGDQQRFRFDLSFNLNTNFVWDRFEGRLQSRPWKWDVLAVAPEQSVELSITRDEEFRKHLFTFQDLRDPSHLLAVMGGPLLARSFEFLGLNANPVQQAHDISLGIEWDAHTDRQKIGNTPLSVYRLQSRLFADYHVVIFILQSGEILRVELPDGITLVNDELTSM